MYLQIESNILTQKRTLHFVSTMGHNSIFDNKQTVSHSCNSTTHTHLYKIQSFLFIYILFVCCGHLRSELNIHIFKYLLLLYNTIYATSASTYFHDEQYCVWYCSCSRVVLFICCCSCDLWNLKFCTLAWAILMTAPADDDDARWREIHISNILKINIVHECIVRLIWSYSHMATYSKI